MSLRIDFDFYDSEGKILNSGVPYCSVSNYNDYTNLNVIHKNFFENYNHPMTLRRHDLDMCYASPSHIMEYMFDLKTGELLPNRFLKW